MEQEGGGKDERTEWHRIVAWGRTGELCAQYLSKGRTVYVEGRIQTREWGNKEGQKQRTTEIVAQTVQFLGRPFRADEWLLYSMESPAAVGARGFASGRLYARDGSLVVSVVQEGLVRPTTRG